MHNSSTTAMIITGIVFVVLLTFYIIGQVMSKKGKLTITANGWDMAMLLTVPITVLVAWCWGFDHPLNTVQIVLLIIAGLCFLGTITMSIVYNWGHVMHIVISIMSKLFIMWLTMMIIFMIIVAFIIVVMISLMKGHDDDDEYILLKYNRTLRTYVGYRI